MIFGAQRFLWRSFIFPLIEGLLAQEGKTSTTYFITVSG